MADDPRAALVAALEHRFADPALLRAALVHRSHCAEHGGDSNERLEFLGDAVLGLAVTDFVYRSYPSLPEGELAKVRAAVVNAETLAEVAREIGLGPALLLGKGEAGSGGREKSSILADTMEAVIAAVYLDAGWRAAYDLVERLLADRIDLAAAGPGGQDFKTRLQELVAQRFEQLPRYQIRHEGPDHDRRYFATVLLAGTPRGHGEGRSKKQAEQDAAREAWEWCVAQLARSADAAPVAAGKGGDDAGAA